MMEIRKVVRLSTILMLLLALPQVMYSIPTVKAENPATFTTTGTSPTKLSVYLGPPVVQAVGGLSHYVVFIGLQDAAGNAAFAPAGGIGIGLSSSTLAVGTVPLTTTIAAGSTFVRTWFRSTAAAGTSVITASASGYTSGSATITTVEPSAPENATKLAVYAPPPKLPANGAQASYIITVQLQNATGNPATAPSPGVGVGLLSSNTTVGTVSPSSVTIATGATYAQVSFVTTYVPGSTLITAASPGYSSGSVVMTTVAPVPTKLVVYTAPPSVPAVPGTHTSIISVQLQDVLGNPARASIATSVSLTSSNSTVGTVTPLVTIGAGSTFASANFVATYTPGSTLITAIAAGYTSGSAVMRTVAPIPVKLAVYGGPPLPANNLWHYTPVVQLQDATGNPAMAPAGGISVALTSSNPLVGTVTTPVTIGAGDTFAHISFKSTLTAGSTIITAFALGYTSGSDTVTTVTPVGSPSKLAVYSVPPRVPARNILHYYPIIVQLQNASGYPVNAPVGGIGISLSSSNPSVGTAPATLTISGGSAYERTSFDSTYIPGSTTVSAVSSGYTSGSRVVTTTGVTPSQLAVYARLPKVPADGDWYSPIVVVQLQDSEGNPAMAPVGGLGVSLWSSNPLVVTLPSSTLTISAGSTYATTGFYSTYVPGSTNIVATVSLLQSTLSLSVSPKTLGPAETLTIRIQLWPKISTALFMYYRVGAGPWTLAPVTVITNSTGGCSITVSGSAIPLGTYDLVVVWMGSATYRGAVSEIRSFTRV
jgi:hypothetical protein